MRNANAMRAHCERIASCYAQDVPKKRPAPRSNFVVRLSDEERSALEALAGRLGLTVSGALRVLVQGLVLGELNVVRVPPKKGGRK
jgi:hypothetical protein